MLGVEFSADLHGCAERNIALYRAAGRCRAGEVASLHADATGFAFPPGPLVVYFFNPFGPAVLGQVLANLNAALRGQPRPVTVIGLYMADPQALADALEGFRLRRSWHRYRVYQFEGFTAPRGAATPLRPTAP